MRNFSVLLCQFSGSALALASEIRHSRLRFFPHIIVWGSYFWGCSRRRPTDRRPTDDRPTDRPPPRSELLLAPPLSFFYTHTRHTHVDSLTHTRQTHTRSLTVPFFYTHTRHTHVDSLTHTRQTHTRSLTVPFAHGARAGASRLVSAGRGSTSGTSGSGRCPSAFRGPPP